MSIYVHSHNPIRGVTMAKNRKSTMKTEFKAILVFSVLLLSVTMFAFQASLIPASHLIQPEELVQILKSKAAQPLMLQVGSHVLYQQAHIPGSEYVGAGSTDAGLAQLRDRVTKLPRNKAIVLYCGCCPWGHCPNVKPADDALRALGFTNVKVLYIANNFGTDWVNRGYPVAKGD